MVRRGRAGDRRRGRRRGPAAHRHAFPARLRLPDAQGPAVVPRPLAGRTARRHTGGDRAGDYPPASSRSPAGATAPRTRRYDGGRGYTPVGAVGGRHRAALRGQLQLHPGLPGAGQVLGAEDAPLAATAGARVIHQTVANRVVVGPNGEVRGVDYLAWTGDTFPSDVPHTITARRYVLAAHSVENAKLLLMSGAANTSDQVGRNLMDHPFLLSWARPTNRWARSAARARRRGSKRCATGRIGPTTPRSGSTSTTGDSGSSGLPSPM